MRSGSMKKAKPIRTKRSQFVGPCEDMGPLGHGSTGLWAMAPRPPGGRSAGLKLMG